VANLPVLKPREVVKLLSYLGFIEVRQRGSHKQFRHADGRATTVPFHQGRDISPVLLRKIARDIGMTAEELLGKPDIDRSEPSSGSEITLEHQAESDVQDGGESEQSTSP
jgi:predicted RNA binding protein YcfA (HicA-like mRNA interferase family)